MNIFYVCMNKSFNGFNDYSCHVYYGLTTAYESFRSEKKTYLDSNDYHCFEDEDKHFKAEDDKGNAVSIILISEDEMLGQIEDWVKASKDTTDVEYWGENGDVKHYHAPRINMPFNDDGYVFKVHGHDENDEPFTEKVSPYMILLRPYDLETGDTDNCIVDVYEMRDGEEYVESIFECPENVFAGIFMHLFEKNMA